MRGHLALSKSPDRAAAGKRTQRHVNEFCMKPVKDLQHDSPKGVIYANSKAGMDNNHMQKAANENKRLERPINKNMPAKPNQPSLGPNNHAAEFEFQVQGNLSYPRFG